MSSYEKFDFQTKVGEKFVLLKSSSKIFLSYNMSKHDLGARRAYRIKISPVKHDPRNFATKLISFEQEPLKTNGAALYVIKALA